MDVENDLLAAQDWEKLDLDNDGEWQVGRFRFKLNLREWVVIRMYNLTGEHIARQHISSHTQVLKCQFLYRHERMQLITGDADLSKILAVLCPGKASGAAARLKVMQAELTPTSEEAGLTFEEIIAKRSEKKGYEFMLDLLRSKRHLTNRVLQSLEDAEMIEHTDGEWRLSKQFEDATAA